MKFDAPGPGQWTLDTAHFPRPVTRFTAEIFPQAATDGFRQGTEPYGLLLDFVEWAFVHRWAYSCPRPVPELGESGAVDRQAWEAAVRSSPGLARRLATSEKVFERRPWRAELATWENRAKPVVVDSHRQLQSVDPAALGHDGLLEHLHQCRQSLWLAIRLHHRLNVTPVLPVGDLLARAERWDGVSSTQLLALLPRAGPLDDCEGHLAAVVEGASRDPAAAAALFAPDAAAHSVLAALRSRPSPAGQATSAYLDLVANWATGAGTDVADARLIEVPHLLVEAIRARARQPAAGAHHGHDGADDLRRAVPAAERAAFDDLLAEARAVHRLRDERALYCDVWANGLARRAILAAGERLAGEGRLERPDHLVEASYGEMRSMMRSRPGPAADELARRARLRQQANSARAPVVLGKPTRSPVPTAWLPPGAARTEQAFRTYLAAMSPTVEAHADGPVVRGTGASHGLYEGRARVVRDPAQLERVSAGDVLVTETTSPAFNLALGLAGALVTDGGGLLSHAAIIAREYGIPAIVGCGDATRRIPDGAGVRVDGRSGEATVVSRQA